jgi:hypothetical protein
MLLVFVGLLFKNPLINGRAIYDDPAGVESPLALVESLVFVVSLLPLELESLVDSVLIVMSNEPAQLIGFSGAEGE